MPAGEQGRRIAFRVGLNSPCSAGAEIAGTVFQMRDSADPATLVGRGKLDEIRAEATAHQAPLIILTVISLRYNSGTSKKPPNAA